eukprot:scaffold173911_cov69-Cyclotella_meneghiniana.AAC.3
MGGENFSSSSSHSHIPHQDCVCLDQRTQFTAAGLVQCLSIDIWDGETRLRLEFIVYNGLCKLTLEPWVGKISAAALLTSHILSTSYTKVVSVWTSACNSQQLA